MTGSAAERATADPFGLRSLTAEQLRAKRGAKWQSQPTEDAAWVADMDFPVAPAIQEAMPRGDRSQRVRVPRTGADRMHSSPASRLFGPRMAERYGWELSEERVHDLIDVIQGIRSTVLHRSSPGDGIVLHLPAYHPFLDTIELMDRRLVSVLADDAGVFDYDALEAELQRSGAKIWILCHPHNPLGRSFERAELERIAEIAERFDLLVLSDEIHADLTMPGHRHVPFASLGPEVAARTVTVTSASKAFNLAGLRWAVVHAGDEELHRVLGELPGHYLGAPNVMAVTAAVAAWTEGDSWLAAVVDVLDENRLALPGLLDRHLPGAVCSPPEATYLAWIDCRRLDLGDDPAAVFADRGVRLSPGAQFGPPGLGHVRLNISTSPSVLAETIEAMSA